MHHSAEEQCDTLMLAPLHGDAADQRPAKRGHHQKYEENDAGDDEVGYQRDALIDDANAGVPGIGEIDGHAALLQLIEQREGGVRKKHSLAGGGMPCSLSLRLLRGFWPRARLIILKMAKTVTRIDAKAVVLLSGGMDSCVCAATARERHGPGNVALLHASYGQRTESREAKAFSEIADFYAVKQRLMVRLEHFRAIGGSALTDPSIAVPENELGAPGPNGSAIPVT